ncbi:glycine/betaine ABC transporter, partial [Glycocaulis profundi]
MTLGLTLAACGGDPTSDDSAKSAKDTITVGSAEFPENVIIAEIYAQALEAKGVKVTKKLNIGSREVYLPALKNGEIDLIPEYSGNLLSYLDPKATATSPKDVVDAIDDALPDNLDVLD